MGTDRLEESPRTVNLENPPMKLWTLVRIKLAAETMIWFFRQLQKPFYCARQWAWDKSTEEQINVINNRTSKHR